ncbi:MAG: hypothetical protein AAF575_05760 [Bacteroidota bacterium]
MKTSSFVFHLLILASVSFFCSIPKLYAQNDTIWYNAEWKEAEKQGASFYRVTSELENGLFNMKDYYKSGKLQMEGVSTARDRDSWEGKVVWYREDGTIFQVGNFEKGRLEGEFISYLGKEKLAGTYKNGRFVQGRQNVDYRNYLFYSEFRSDTLIEISHKGSLSGRRNIRYSITDPTGKRVTVKSQSYDAEEQIIAEATYEDGVLHNGSEFSFYNIDTASQTIVHYEKGKYLNTSYYDDSGILRVHFMVKPVYQTVFYSDQGNKLDSIEYKWKNGYLIPFNGKNYTGKKGYFSSSNIEFGTIQAYENGATVWEKKFTDGYLSSYTSYDEKNRKEKVLYYNRLGKVNDSLVYKDYVPWNGTEYALDFVRKYKEGKLIQETQFYRDTQKIFKKRNGALEVYYDKEGREMGKMVLSQENYYTPLDGKQCFIDSKGRLINIYEYEDGAKIKETTLSYDYDTGVAYREETFFDSGGYNYIKKVKYHGNGNKRSEIRYKRYKETQGIFYDKAGKQISTYDYLNQDGELWEYFYGTDMLSKVERRSNGILEKLLRYEQRYFQGRTKKQVLVEDIDLSSHARIYTRDGELLSDLKYKNKEPYEGTFYDYQTKERITYAMGVKNGTYEKLNYNQEPEIRGAYSNGRKDGKFIYYNANGAVTHFINYDEGKKEGEATYFDTNGKVVSTMLFKNDMPYDGKEILSTYREKIEKVYEKGTLKSELKYLDTGNVLRKRNEDGNDEVTVYHPKTNTIKYNFYLNGEMLNGPVIRYRIDGTEIHRAFFNKGIYESGTVWVLPVYDYDKELEKVACTKTEKGDEIQYISKEGDIVFKAFELTRPSASKKYMDGLDFRMDNINYLDLY